jgi:hypothetical protein
MAETSRVVRLAGSTIDCRCHVCALFDSREQEYQVLLPFMKEPPERFLQELDGRRARVH